MSFEIVMVRSGKDPPPEEYFCCPEGGGGNLLLISVLEGGRGNFLCGRGMDVFWNEASIQPAAGYLVNCRLYNDYSYI
jgi:hypothetical protein